MPGRTRYSSWDPTLQDMENAITFEATKPRPVSFEAPGSRFARQQYERAPRAFQQLPSGRLHVPPSPAPPRTDFTEHFLQRGTYTSPTRNVTLNPLVSGSRGGGLYDFEGLSVEDYIEVDTELPRDPMEMNAALGRLPSMLRGNTSMRKALETYPGLAPYYGIDEGGSGGGYGYGGWGSYGGGGGYGGWGGYSGGGEGSMRSRQLSPRRVSGWVNQMLTWRGV